MLVCLYLEVSDPAVELLNRDLLQFGDRFV